MARGKKGEARIDASGSAKKKKGGPGRPFEPGNPYRIQPGQVLNPAGSSSRQRIRRAYEKVLDDDLPEALLKAIKEKHPLLGKLIEAGPKNGSGVLALRVWIKAALEGDLAAAIEIRKVTEGEWLRTWQDEVIDLLRDGKVQPDDVRQELGDDVAEELIAAAGLRRDEGRPPDPPSPDEAPGETDG